MPKVSLYMCVDRVGCRRKGTPTFDIESGFGVPRRELSLALAL